MSVVILHNQIPIKYMNVWSELKETEGLLDNSFHIKTSFDNIKFKLKAVHNHLTLTYKYEYINASIKLVIKVFYIGTKILGPLTLEDKWARSFKTVGLTVLPLITTHNT